MSSDDKTLIEDCLAGRPDAFGRLVVRYQDRLYNALVNVVGSADDARDIAQDAFVHAYRKLGSFRGDAAFYSWLFRIALNTAVSEKRKRRRTPASIDSARERAGAEPTDNHPDAQPSHALEVSERRQLVQDAIAQLPEEFRTVLVLKEMEGMTYEEIAGIVECPIGTVRSRIHRARSELRHKLELALKPET